MTPAEKKKAYMKQYRLRPEVKARRKKYLEETKHIRAKQYKQYHKEYRNTPQYAKCIRINNWKQRNIIFHDWDLLHDVIYSLTSHCDNCGVYLEGTGNAQKCV